VGICLTLVYGLVAQCSAVTVELVLACWPTITCGTPCA